MQKETPFFSIVIPLYNCANNIEELCTRLNETIAIFNKSFEIILINDNSQEDDWNIVKNLSKELSYIKGINLSKNFGQHYAITAGLEHAKGFWVIVMDGDLQDKPEEIKKLYEKTKEGFDIVLAQRFERKDKKSKKFFSSLYYKVFSFLTDVKQDSSIANYGIYSKKSIDAVLQMKDSTRYFPTMINWVGFNKTSVNVEHEARKHGKSSYNFRSLLNLAFNNIIAFSNKPLKLVIKFGFFIVFISFLIALYYLVNYFIGNLFVIGYASLIISIWFLFGVTISVLGIIGVYLGKVFEKVRDRPLYLIKEKINL